MRISKLLSGLSILSIAGFIGTGSILAQGQPGGLQLAASEDIRAKTLSGGHYSELWNYQIYLDNGMSLYIVFSVADFGRLKSAVSGIRVSMYGLDDDVYHINREYPVSDLLQDPENLEFNINPRQNNIWFKGKLPDEHEIYINTEKSGNRFKIHLKFHDIQAGYKMGDGLFDVDGEEVGIITHIPFAKVTGYAGINDHVPDVNGIGYMDHTWQFQSAARLFSSGYRFVYHRNVSEWDLIYFMVPAKRGQGPIGYRLYAEAGKVKLEGVAEVENISMPSDRNIKVPLMMDLFLESGAGLRVENQELTDVSSVFTELNWVARNLMRRIAGGKMVDYRGTGKMRVGESLPKKGYYNYSSIE